MAWLHDQGSSPNINFQLHRGFFPLTQEYCLTNACVRIRYFEKIISPVAWFGEPPCHSAKVGKNCRIGIESDMKYRPVFFVDLLRIVAPPAHTHKSPWHDILHGWKIKVEMLSLSDRAGVKPWFVTCIRVDPQDSGWKNRKTKQMGGVQPLLRKQAGKFTSSGIG